MNLEMSMQGLEKSSTGSSRKYPASNSAVTQMQMYQLQVGTVAKRLDQGIRANITGAY